MPHLHVSSFPPQLPHRHTSWPGGAVKTSVAVCGWDTTFAVVFIWFVSARLTPDWDLYVPRVFFNLCGWDEIVSLATAVSKGQPLGLDRYRAYGKRKPKLGGKNLLSRCFRLQLPVIIHMYQHTTPSYTGHTSTRPMDLNLLDRTYQEEMFFNVWPHIW